MDHMRAVHFSCRNSHGCIPHMLYTSHACLQAALEDVEDLEADARPEDLMMSYVSGEKGKVQLLIHAFFPLGCSLPIVQCMHQLAARGWPTADWCCVAKLPPEQLSGCPCLAAASPSWPTMVLAGSMFSFADAQLQLLRSVLPWSEKCSSATYPLWPASPR